MAQQSSGVSALYQRLAEDLPEIPWTREPRYLSAVQELPLGIVTAGRAERHGEPGDPAWWEQTCPVLIYVQRTNTQDADLLALVDRVESALLPHTGERTEGWATSLGGTVRAAWLQSYTLGHAPEPNTPSVAVMLEIHLAF